MKLSKVKRDKISEQILSLLYHQFPKSLFTAEIARELVRDEEFIKTIMFELKEKTLVTAIKKNSLGEVYSRRIRWALAPQAHKAYQSI